MEEVPDLGTAEDRARRIDKPRMDSLERQKLVETARANLYKHGFAITGEKVDGVLKEQSYVPTVVSLFISCFPPHLTLPQNSFSTAFFSSGGNFFLMLVVDLLHEFELGVWKAVFCHLIRILESVDVGLVQKLNER